MGEIRATRVAVIGDLAGHSAQLRRTLEDLGVGFDADADVCGQGWDDVDIDWPPGLHVVQVGDLVHRGPDSLGVVLLADRLIGMGVWTQVVGNHEQVYVDRPVFEWPEVIDQQASDLLRTWWSDGRMVPGAVIETASDGDWLVTHAGLAAGFWEYGLGRPRSREDVLEALKEAADDGALWHPGRMLTGRVDSNAGPVWAEAGHEVYRSWIDADEASPFHQVHGHSTAYSWDEREWRADRRVRRISEVDELRRHVTFTQRGRRFVGVDPDHGVAAAVTSAALMLEGVVVCTPGLLRRGT